MQDRLDILTLEREFDRLRRFLAQEGLPLARAAAIARFATALPDGFQGRAYYLAELRGDAREAFEPARAQTRDPRLLDLLRRAEETLEIAPAGGIAPRRARPEPDDPPGTEQQAPHPCPRFQSHVEVPLVQLLPETSLTPADPGAVGVIARVTVVPAAGVRGPRIEWHNRRAAEPAGDLRSLQDVGADALLAARQALRADEARAPARDRIAARLERLLVGGDEVSAAIGRPEIVEPWRLPADLVESCTRRRLRLALQGAALAVLAVLLLYHLPLRPRRLTIDGPAMALRVHYQGLWPSRLLGMDSVPMYAALVDDLDGDEPGARRIVYATDRGGRASRHDRPDLAEHPRSSGRPAAHLLRDQRAVPPADDRLHPHLRSPGPADRPDRQRLLPRPGGGPPAPGDHEHRLRLRLAAGRLAGVLPHPALHPERLARAVG